MESVIMIAAVLIFAGLFIHSIELRKDLQEIAKAIRSTASKEQGEDSNGG